MIEEREKLKNNHLTSYYTDTDTLGTSWLEDECFAD